MGTENETDDPFWIRFTVTPSLMGVYASDEAGV